MIEKLYLSEERVEVETLLGLISVNPLTGDALCIDSYGEVEAISTKLAKSELLQAKKRMEKKLIKINNALKKLERIS